MTDLEREERFIKIYNEYIDVLLDEQSDILIKCFDPERHNKQIERALQQIINLKDTRTRVNEQGIYRIELQVWTMHRA